MFYSFGVLKQIVVYGQHKEYRNRRAYLPSGARCVCVCVSVSVSVCVCVFLGCRGLGFRV